MQRKSILAVFLALIMIAAALTACSKKPANAPEDTKTEDKKQEDQKQDTKKDEEKGKDSAQSDIPKGANITFWHGMSGQQETTLTELTNQFNQENQYGITVTLVNQGAYKDLSTKLTASAAADALPDLAQAYNNWLVPYLDKVVKLDDFVAKDFDNYDDIMKSYRDETSEFGFIHALPFNKSTYVYFYNKTLFDELGLSAPKTWDDLVNIGKTFKEKKNMVSLGYDDLPGMLSAMLKQNGDGYVTKDGVQFDNKAGEETLDFIMSLYNNGYARLVGEDKYFSGPFSNQLIAAYVGSSTGVSYIKHEGWELGVAPLPSKTDKAANAAGTNIVMFSKDTGVQKAAWEYLKFLTGKDATTKWAMETGYLPIRKSAYESETYQKFMKQDPTAQAAYAQSEAFFSDATFEGSQNVMNAVRTKLEELILNHADGKTAMEELTKAIQRAMAVK